MKNTEDYVYHNKKPPRIQYFATFTSCLNMVCSGMHYGWCSVSLPQLLQKNSYMPLSDDDGSWVAVILLIGAICGSILAGIILDKLGRKNVILLASIPFFISWIMVAFVRSVPLLMFARFIAGISDGLVYCSLPMYLGEISDPRIRGFTGSSITVSWISGMLLINIIGTYLSITTTALICAILPLIVLVTFSRMPESPYYLIMKDNVERARRSLKILKGTIDVEQEVNRLVKAAESQTLNTRRYSDLFTIKSNRKAFIIILGLRGTHQFTGTTAILFYVQTIFGEAGNNISPSLTAIIYFTMQLILAGCSSLIVDKSGRKPLLIISLTGVILVLLTEAIYFTIKNTTDIDTSSLALISVIGFIVYTIVYNIGMHTVPLILVGELFPTNVKAFAVCFSDIYECVVATILSKFFQFAKDGFGLHVPLFVFAILSATGLLFIIFFVSETKGKTLEEIQQELQLENKTYKEDMGKMLEVKQ